MSEKDKRPPVGVGAGKAAFGTAAFSDAHYTALAKRRLIDGYCEGRLSLDLVRRAFRHWPWLRGA